MIKGIKEIKEGKSSGIKCFLKGRLVSMVEMLDLSVSLLDIYFIIACLVIEQGLFQTPSGLSLTFN